MILAQQALDESNLGRVQQLLEKHHPKPGEPDLRGWEWRYFWRETQSDELCTLGAHPTLVDKVAFSKKGDLLASRDHDGGIKVWDVPGRKPLETAIQTERGGDFAFGPDGALAVVAHNLVRFYTPETGRESGPPLIHSAEVAALVYSADGRWLVTLSGPELRVVDAVTRRERSRYAVQPGLLLALSPDNHTAAIETTENVLVLWDILTGVQIGRWSDLPELGWGPGTLAFSPEGRRLAVTSRKSTTVKVWDIATQRLANELRTPMWSGAVAFTPDGRSLFRPDTAAF